MGKIRSLANEASRVVHEVPAEADEALQNWARWSRTRQGGGRRVNPGFKYVKPDRWPGRDDDAGAPSAFAGPVDGPGAWRAEKALCALPLVQRVMLRSHYLDRRDPRSTCRDVHLHVDAYDLELWRAACMFLNLYRQQPMAGVCG
jgi:hypothetical protein